MSETNKWSSYMFHMNVTNNFFIVNGQASKDFPNTAQDETFVLDFVSTIYPLDAYGNFIWVGKDVNNMNNRRIWKEKEY